MSPSLTQTTEELRRSERILIGRPSYLAQALHALWTHLLISSKNITTYFCCFWALCIYNCIILCRKCCNFLKECGNKIFWNFWFLGRWENNLRRDSQIDLPEELSLRCQWEVQRSYTHKDLNHVCWGISVSSKHQYNCTYLC